MPPVARPVPAATIGRRLGPTGGEDRRAGAPTTSVLTRRLVTLSGPSPDRASVTCAASPGLADFDSASPMALAPASIDGRMSQTEETTCVCAPQSRASAEIRRLSGSSGAPSTSTASDADAITRTVSARSDAA